MALNGTWAQTSKPASPLNEADDYLRKGVAAQQRNDLNAAIDDYRKALAIDPKLAEARANLGQLCRQQASLMRRSRKTTRSWRRLRATSACA